MQPRRLTHGEVILAASSGLLLASSFVPAWATFRVTGFEHLGAAATLRLTAWNGFPYILRLALLAAAMGIALPAMSLMGSSIARGLGLNRLVAGLGFAFATVAVIAGPIGSSDVGHGIEVTRGPLAYLAVALSAAMVVGAWLHSRAETSASHASEGLATLG